MAGESVDTGTAPASLPIGSTYTVQPKVTLILWSTLLALAGQYTLFTFAISGAKIGMEYSGFTGVATATQTGTDTVHLPAPYNQQSYWRYTTAHSHPTPTHPTTPAVRPTTTPTYRKTGPPPGEAATLLFKKTPVTMTAAPGVTATVSTLDLTFTYLIRIKCHPKTYAHPVSFGTIDKIESTVLLPHLAPAAGALPNGQVTAHYTESTYWSTVGGTGTTVWSATGVPAGLTFTGTGRHASLTGTPTTADIGSHTITVTVTTRAGHQVTQAYTLSIAPRLAPITVTATGTDPTVTTSNPTTTLTLTASATGSGTLTVGTYRSDPVAAYSPASAFVDVQISPTSSFSSVSFQVCGLSPGETISWWNPGALAWQAVSDATTVNPQGCSTVTVTSTTNPSLSELGGTVFSFTPTTPSALQPFSLTVTPSTLTLTCTTATGAAKPTVSQDVTSQTSAKPCTQVTLGNVKLNEKRHILDPVGHNLIISTARGGANDSWALYAVMVPTSTALTGNPACDFVQGFCNKTTTNGTTFPSHIRNTTITPNYLGVTSKCETNHANPLTTYFNDNPTPAATAGVAPGTPGLAVQTKLCSATSGFSGGQFFVTTIDYELIVPPNVYAGTYYGTVLYTLSETAAIVPPNPVTPPQ